MHIKPQIRILAIDDSSIKFEKVTIIGTFFRGGLQLDGILKAQVTKDGMDATDILAGMIRNSKFFSQIRVIILDGVTYAGFNPVDITLLHEKTNIPVIVFMRSCPDFEKIKLALTHLSYPDLRWEMIQRAGKIYKIDNKKPVYIQICGIDRESAARIIKITSRFGNIPEPLRTAHIIATGIVLGESKGKA